MKAVLSYTAGMIAGGRKAHQVIQVRELKQKLEWFILDEVNELNEAKQLGDFLEYKLQHYMLVVQILEL